MSTILVEEGGVVYVVREGFEGPQGPAGNGEGAQAHIHTQSLAASVWTINHALGRGPAVTVFDSSGDECYGAIEHPTATQTNITFSAPFAGTARLV